jgi:hypothetical protein
MAQLGWHTLIGAAIVLLVPLYLILQTWFGCAWAGRWRMAALVPLIGFVPALIIALLQLSRGSNLWPLTVIFFAPLGFIYLLVAAIARQVVSRRRAA